MAEIIDLEFYRKFRIILHIRGTTRRQLKKDKASAMGQQTKHYQRKKDLDGETKRTNKD